jgi:hypothetical protein
MYGSRRSDAIRILTWRPIASEYAEGETLRLSYRDRMTLAVQLEVARGNPELKDLRPVGWFVSHPNGGVAMTASDLEIYAGFFPESSQITLAIHPTGGGRAEAGFFARAADGSVRSEASYQNFVLSPLDARPTQAPPADASDMEPAPPEIADSESGDTPPSVPDASVPDTGVPGPSAPGPGVPDAGVPRPGVPRPSVPRPSVAPGDLSGGSGSPHMLAAPTFQTHEPLPARERWLWAIPIALALGLAAWPLYQRQKPAENSPMGLRISFNATRIAQLEWDPNSRAVRESERGEIDITDDGKTSRVLLSSDQLHAGKLAYLPQSSDTGFKLTVYPAGGAPVHETARLIAPAFSAPTQPPQLLDTAPAPASAEDDALQTQVRQLREDLRKERARTGELQNLNRILENRLGIQPDVPKAEPQQ